MTLISSYEKRTFDVSKSIQLHWTISWRNWMIVNTIDETTMLRFFEISKHLIVNHNVLSYVINITLDSLNLRFNRIFNDKVNSFIRFLRYTIYDQMLINRSIKAITLSIAHIKTIKIINLIINRIKINKTIDSQTRTRWRLFNLVFKLQRDQIFKQTYQVRSIIEIRTFNLDNSLILNQINSFDLIVMIIKLDLNNNALIRQVWRMIEMTLSIKMRTTTKILIRSLFIMITITSSIRSRRTSMKTMKSTYNLLCHFHQYYIDVKIAQRSSFRETSSLDIYKTFVEITSSIMNRRSLKLIWRIVLAQSLDQTLPRSSMTIMSFVKVNMLRLSWDLVKIS